MKLSHFNIDEFTKDLPEISSPNIFESNKLTANGLFSQQIFGPLKSYKCGCTRSIYRGPHSIEEKCEVCDVEITTSEERSKRYAKISLPYTILNPLVYMLVKKAKPSCKKILNDILFYKQAYYFDEEGLIKPYDPNVDTDKYKLEGIDGTKKYILHLCKNSDKAELEFIKTNEDIITCNSVVVIPPAFRSFSKNSNGSCTTDALNKHYQELLIRINNITKLSFLLKEDSDQLKSYFNTVQIHTINIYEYIIDKLSKKTGLIRGNILGKRVDFSGRAVISPDPTLNLDECKIPYLILLEMYKPKLITYLVNRKVVTRHNKASDLIDQCIVKNDQSLLPILEDFIKDKVCILNRQPTLHRLSVLAFKVLINPGNTIMIHPLVCASYNADFDGDQMAVYVSMTDKCTDDIRSKIGIWNNLLSPTDGTLVPRPNQDIILGIYTATKLNTNKIYEYKNAKLSKGRYLFNQCLPIDYPLIDDTVDKNTLLNILNDIALTYTPSECIKTLDAVKNLGFELSTANGYTLSIDDLYIEEFEDFTNTLNGTVEENIYKLNNNQKIQRKIRKKPYYTYIESGARGSMDQLTQLVVARGYVADVNNKIRPNMIKSSLSVGLDQREFFDSSWGTRKGLLDTALSTSSSGYLTRQLIYSTVNMELGEVDDCGTEDYVELDILIKNKDGSINDKATEKLARSLIWRYIVSLDGKTTYLITKNNYKAIIGRKIKLRSPIYCKSKKICKKCYGNLSNVLHSDQIGIIATQGLGEISTQLVLRTFHISGVVQGSGKDGSNDDIISGMGLVNKIFHRPSKIPGVEEPIDLVLKLNEIFSQYGNIMLVHFETIVSAMMWSEDELWRNCKNRNNRKYTYESILKIPSLGSWLLGISFARLKSKLLDGLVNQKVDTPTAISKLFRY